LQIIAITITFALESRRAQKHAAFKD